MKSIKRLDPKIKFSYANKLEIAQILGLYKADPTLKKKLKLINKLRNSIAHSLHYDEKVLEELQTHFDTIKGKINDSKSSTLTNEETAILNLEERRVKVKGKHMKLLLLFSFTCGQIAALGSTKAVSTDN